MRVNNDCPWSIVVAEDSDYYFSPFQTFVPYYCMQSKPWTMEKEDGGWRMGGLAGEKMTAL